MSATVTLTVVEGRPDHVEYTFDSRAVGAVGRAQDCMVHLPNDLLHLDVSRHHCLLDVNPPCVRIRDLGSRNGTYVNGHKIGQRSHNLQAESAVGLLLPTCELHDGDELRIASTRFRVEVEDTARDIEPPASHTLELDLEAQMQAAHFGQ